MHQYAKYLWYNYYHIFFSIISAISQLSYVIRAHRGNLTSTVYSIQKHLFITYFATDIFQHRACVTLSRPFRCLHKFNIWYLYWSLHWPLKSGVRHRRIHMLHTSYSSTNCYRQHQSLINLTLKLKILPTAGFRCFRSVFYWCQKRKQLRLTYPKSRAAYL